MSCTSGSFKYQIPYAQTSVNDSKVSCTEKQFNNNQFLHYMNALNRYAHTAHWFLRLIFISVFLYHGLDKFGNLSGFADMADMPVAMAFIIALFETVGGIFIFVGGFSRHWGWLTRVGALLIIPIMLGAIFMVHWGQ